MVLCLKKEKEKEKEKEKTVVKKANNDCTSCSGL
jgi:hypothetical protein